jgi:hypothetical protein
MKSDFARLRGTSGHLASLCAITFSLIAVIGGCSPDTGPRSPSFAKVPLAPHSHVLLKVRACNRGANAFCALEAVVIGSGYPSSNALLESETRLLRRLHWRRANADTGLQRAAYSPGGKLRLTYATAHGELEGIDLGWQQRRHAIEVALAHTLFVDRPALSLLVEEGTG